MKEYEGLGRIGGEEGTDCRKVGGLALAENAGKNLFGIGHVVVCLFLNTAFEAESFAQISNVL